MSEKTRNADAAAPFIGIVTVLYNSDAVLPDFFISLAAQRDVHFRLYVIDNSASDSGTKLSRQLAQTHGIDADCLFNNANVGVAKGNNQGIVKAVAEGCTHVLLANNDTAFEAGTINRLLAAMAETGSPAATPKTMYHGEPDRIWCAGGYINLLKVTNPHYGEREVDHGQFDLQRHVAYAPTCFMLIERAVFDAVGLMDETYFVYYDDTDFVWRMTQQDFRLLYVPDAKVLHKVSSSTGGSYSPFTMYWANRNRLYFLFKNLHGPQRWLALTYVMSTRLPRLLSLPSKSASEGWRGVRDGFRLATKTRRLARASASASP